MHCYTFLKIFSNYLNNVMLPYLLVAIHISAGTFGWWAGYLAGGEVVYLKEYVTPGSIMSQGIKQSDMYPESWIPISGNVTS